MQLYIYGHGKIGLQWWSYVLSVGAIPNSYEVNED